MQFAGFKASGKTAQRKFLNRLFGEFAKWSMGAREPQPCYLSGFTYDRDSLRTHLERTPGSVRDLRVLMSADFITFDLDGTDEQRTLDDARKLYRFLLETYGLEPHLLWCYFSGSKGYHICLPTDWWTPEPAEDFNVIARTLATGICRHLGISTIDGGVFLPTQLVRAPNSLHESSGLFKRQIEHDELGRLTPGEIRGMAREPFHTMPELPEFHSVKLAADWQKAAAKAREVVVQNQRRSTSDELLRITRMALAGDIQTERHKAFYSAARNLAEHGADMVIINELLLSKAVKTGLESNDARRQLECGWTAGRERLSDDGRTGNG